MTRDGTINASALEAPQRENRAARQKAGRLRTVRTGFAHHQAGRLRQAAALYRKVLDKNPDDPNALHLLGVVANQRGAAGSAVCLIERALPALSDIPDVHLNRGNALREVGRLAEAVASYRRALTLNPDYGIAHNNLAAALNEGEEFEAGLASSERAIALIPEFFGTYVNHAGALMGLGGLPKPRQRCVARSISPLTGGKRIATSVGCSRSSGGTRKQWPA